MFLRKEAIQIGERAGVPVESFISRSREETLGP